MFQDAQSTPGPLPGPRARFRWRRLFQYRLRTLLIVTTIVAAAFGWWSYKARQQREAVATLERRGASFQFDYEEPAGFPPFVFSLSLPEHREPKFAHWPQWLVRLLGVHYFADVTSVSLWGVDSPLDGRVLERLPKLRLLYGGTAITDPGLKHVGQLAALEELSLFSDEVSDAGLEHLARLAALRRLQIGSSRVTDAGLEHFMRLTSLEYLDLRGTQVTDAGVARLQQALQKCHIEYFMSPPVRSP
ncbi:MAG: hypothetical protein K8T25_23765 [Planctomycetia bacterium]|nr:hypothetical protein [Planctomycetia bacterium]